MANKEINLKDYLISGIQQIGLGNRDVYATWEWYLKQLGFNVPVFDEAAEAALMLPYTGGEPRSRHAVLALNMGGGGGYEIWQYTSREAQPPAFNILPGDLGIYASIVKSSDVQKTYQWLSSENEVSKIYQIGDGRPHFFVKDPYGNPLMILESDDFFGRPSGPHYCGGVYGAVIGVSDLERSKSFYSGILGYDKVVYEKEGEFDDLKYLKGNGRYQRVRLTHSDQRSGAFSQLLGHSEIELIRSLDHSGRPIFKDRMWGDLGYIHLCFDVVNMDRLKAACAKAGYPFAVDSGAFDMGKAAGRFAYIEDPDGALIEFVETYKVPILKKLNWFLDLRKRNSEKTLPKWMLKAMGMNKVKEVPGR